MTILRRSTIPVVTAGPLGGCCWEPMRGGEAWAQPQEGGDREQDAIKDSAGDGEREREGGTGFIKAEEVSVLGPEERVQKQQVWRKSVNECMPGARVRGEGCKSSPGVKGGRGHKNSQILQCVMPSTSPPSPTKSYPFRVE